MGETGCQAPGLEKPIADNVVAIKYGSGLVTGDHYCHPLGNAGSNHIADSSPSEIVQNRPWR
jgi:hypothetical protein